MIAVNILRSSEFDEFDVTDVVEEGTDQFEPITAGEHEAILAGGRGTHFGRIKILRNGAGAMLI